MISIWQNQVTQPAHVHTKNLLNYFPRDSLANDDGNVHDATTIHNPDASDKAAPIPQSQAMQEKRQSRMPQYLSNHPSQYFDLPITGSKDNNTIKIISNNVHMLNCKDPTKATCLLHTTYQCQYDIILLSETAINSWKREAWDAISNITHSIWQHHRLQMNSVPDDSSTTWQPGGVLSLFQGNIISRIQQSGNDEKGRWVWSTLLGRNNKK